LCLAQILEDPPSGYEDSTGASNDDELLHCLL
jgi:hypothetical protein